MKKKLAANKWKMIAISTLAIILMAGVALPAIAAPDKAAPQVSNTPPNVLRGKVTSIDTDNSFYIIQPGEEEAVPIVVDNNTRYFKVTAPWKVAVLIKNRMELRWLGAQGIERPTGATPMNIRAENRAAWLKKVRISKTPTQVQTESQELTINLLTPSEGRGVPKCWPGKLKQLRRFGQKASFETIAIGDKVIACLRPGEDTSVARLVIIIKPSP